MNLEIAKCRAENLRHSMKIFYAVQASGNGHIARAREILPYLKRYGTVDVFLSGHNHDLDLEETRFRSKGISLMYNQSGGLHYLKTLLQLRPAGLLREIASLPVHKYDLVINDFEFITSRACLLRNIPSVCFGHHASFRSPRIPRPSRTQWLGECVLDHFAPASQYTGLHFQRYDDFIFPPVIKEAVLSARPSNKGHITVYLSSVSDEWLMQRLAGLTQYRFEIFSRRVRTKTVHGPFTLYPADNRGFTQSMISCAGVITGGGFETPAEAMALNKKLLVIPIIGQYEQQYNVAALEKMGIRWVPCLDERFSGLVEEWMETGQPVHAPYSNMVPDMLEYILDTYPFGKKVFPAFS